MNQIATKQQSQSIATVLQMPSTLQELARALPSHLNVERFARIALTEVRKNPELAACSPSSFMGALVQSAQLGLEPGSGLGLAYLIPYRNHKTGEVVCTFIPGYKGLLELVRRSGTLRRISAACVYQGDEFDYALGTMEYIKHRPKGDTRAVAVTHAYAVAEFKDGGIQMEVMTRQQIDAIKTRGRANKVWDTDFTEMARKTVLRRICKYLPLSPELADALRADGEADQVLALPDRAEPAKYQALGAADAEDQANERLEKEKLVSLEIFNKAVDDAEAKKLDVEKVLGVTYDQAVSESAAFLEAAAEKLRDASR